MLRCSNLSRIVLGRPCIVLDRVLAAARVSSSPRTRPPSQTPSQTVNLTPRTRRLTIALLLARRIVERDAREREVENSILLYLREGIEPTEEANRLCVDMFKQTVEERAAGYLIEIAPESCNPPLDGSRRATPVAMLWGRCEREKLFIHAGLPAPAHRCGKCGECYGREVWHSQGESNGYRVSYGVFWRAKLKISLAEWWGLGLPPCYGMSGYADYNRGLESHMATWKAAWRAKEYGWTSAECKGFRYSSVLRHYIH